MTKEGFKTLLKNLSYDEITHSKRQALTFFSTSETVSFFGNISSSSKMVITTLYLHVSSAISQLAETEQNCQKLILMAPR